MLALDLSADKLIAALLSLSSRGTVCILDSCGVGHLGSHLLIAGIDPVDVQEVSDATGEKALSVLSHNVGMGFASIFTLSYELGSKLNRVPTLHTFVEPDLFIASFDVLIVHDHDTGMTHLTGNEAKFETVRRKLEHHPDTIQLSDSGSEALGEKTEVSADLSKEEYLSAIERIQARIRCGDTYQTNLTQQFTAKLSAGVTAEKIFSRLRRDHPAPFAAFLRRLSSAVVSASPERFFRTHSGMISTSPIKGTRRRGQTEDEDAELRAELLNSTKDRAENTMIVDLLRNDLGRVCEYGTVRVEKLCDVEVHPTLFHLVSTISGKLRSDATIADIIRALFPCGSITGAPKISTMKIINEVEPFPRGLSMGAIGYFIPGSMSVTEISTAAKFRDPGFEIGTLDLSVAIRTMVVRGDTAIFNTGGGIVIDSEPAAEYAEMQLKAKALLAALGVDNLSG